MDFEDTPEEAAYRAEIRRWLEKNATPMTVPHGARVGVILFDTDLVARLVGLTRAIRVGDPTVKDNWMGPVINKAAHARYAKCVDNLAEHGEILAGGEHLSDGDLVKGYYCAPTIGMAPFDYRLWREEKFIPPTL